MKENVTYIIDAEDKATKKIRKATEQTKQMVSSVKDLGSKSKASTELVGSLAGQLGDSGLSGSAGGVAQLVERVSALSGELEGGGKAAMAMKAGMVAAAAVGGFQLGKALGDIVFQTERWREAQQLAFEEAIAGNAKLQATQDKRFNRELEFIELMDDEASRKNAIQEKLEAASKEAAGTRKQIAKLQEGIEKLGGVSFDLGISETVNSARIETEKNNLELAQQNLATIQKQLDTLNEMNSPAAENLRIAKEEAAAKAKSLSYMESLQGQLKRAQATGDERLKVELQQAGVLDSQLEKALSIRKQVMALQEAEKEAEEKKREQIRLTEALRRKAMQEEKKGITDRISQLKKQQSQLEGLQKISSKPSTELTATNQRLLTGRATAKFAKTAEAIELERQTKLNKDILDVQKDIKELMQDLQTVELNQLGD